MRYNRCNRCELNYINSKEQICDICKKEMSGDYFHEDLILDENICPFCEKHSLLAGEDMCSSCRNKKQKKAESEILND